MNDKNINFQNDLRDIMKISIPICRGTHEGGCQPSA